MASEGKSRKRRSSDSPPPSRDEDERSRKHRKRGEREGKSRRDDDKEETKKRKEKEKKSEKSDKQRKRDKKSGEKRKSKIKNFQELDEKDYFSKNIEFSTWLKEEKGIYFSDLSSEAARDLFTRFVKDWNRQKLGSRYYKGIDAAPRTSHNWNIRADKKVPDL